MNRNEHDRLLDEQTSLKDIKESLLDDLTKWLEKRDLNSEEYPQGHLYLYVTNVFDEPQEKALKSLITQCNGHFEFTDWEVAAIEAHWQLEQWTDENPPSRQDVHTITRLIGNLKNIRTLKEPYWLCRSIHRWLLGLDTTEDLIERHTDEILHTIDELEEQLEKIHSNILEQRARAGEPRETIVIKREATLRKLTIEKMCDAIKLCNNTIIPMDTLKDYRKRWSRLGWWS